MVLDHMIQDQGGKEEEFTGRAILNIFAPKSRKIINWVGSLQFLKPSYPNKVLFPENFETCHPFKTIFGHTQNIISWTWISFMVSC